MIVFVLRMAGDVCVLWGWMRDVADLSFERQRLCFACERVQTSLLRGVFRVCVQKNHIRILY